MLVMVGTRVPIVVVKHADGHWQVILPPRLMSMLQAQLGSASSESVDQNAESTRLGNLYRMAANPSNN